MAMIYYTITNDYETLTAVAEKTDEGSKLNFYTAPSSLFYGV